MNPSTRESRIALLKKLIEIPSFTESTAENDAALFIYSHLSAIPYFKAHPEHLSLIPTPLEKDPRPLHAVCARVMAKIPTPKTLVLISHYDVVETSMYGELQPLACQPNKLADAFLKSPHLLPPQALEDLKSGHFIFGRGAMDMKAGVALELELLRDFAAGHLDLDANLLLLVVPDEENTSAGMRGAISALKTLQETEGLRYIAGVNTEPSSCCDEGAHGENILFTGTIGKISPFFYSIGQSAHVSNYYSGISAALLAAHIITLAEARAEFADTEGKSPCLPWCCLENRIIRESYSVTVPNRNATFFNTFSLEKSPSQILKEMHEIAENAITKTIDQLRHSHHQMSQKGYPLPPFKEILPQVFTLKELSDKAATRLGSKELLRIELEKINTDLSGTIRDREVQIAETLYRLSDINIPGIIIGFLPTYYPARTCRPDSPIDAPLLKTIPQLIEKARIYGEELRIVEAFSGICDLSFLGFQGNIKELLTYEENLPSQGLNCKIPNDDLAALDMPVLNLGVRGYDAHQISERLDTRYSFDILPKLLAYALKTLSKES